MVSIRFVLRLLVNMFVVLIKRFVLVRRMSLRIV